MNAGGDAAEVWANFGSSLRFENIPTAVVDVVKQDILDTIGTITAGATVESASHVVDHMQTLGGVHESTVLGHGFRLPAPNAAMANGALAHALDYDDVYDSSSVHVGVAVIPAALAIAERVGGVHGEEFITAVTLGLEMVCRMSEAPTDGARGDWTSQTWGYMGSALASARLLGLSADRTVDALGLAYGQAAGARQFITDRGSHRSVYGGFAAHGGVTAALLAQRGLTSARDSLEGRYGFYNVYHQGRYDRAPLVEGLGTEFYVRDLGFKCYPSCRNTHPHVDAALRIVEAQDLHPRDIDRIIVHVAGFALDLCTPREVSIDPQVPGQAQYSIPYVVALAVARRRVTLDDFLTDQFRAPDVLELARKVSYVEDASLLSTGLEGGIVEIVSSQGHFTERVDHAKGNPANPMTWADSERKFRECLGYAPVPLHFDEVTTLIERVGTIERLWDTSMLTSAFAGHVDGDSAAGPKLDPITSQGV